MSTPGSTQKSMKTMALLASAVLIWCVGCSGPGTGDLSAEASVAPPVTGATGSIGATSIPTSPNGPTGPGNTTAPSTAGSPPGPENSRTPGSGPASTQTTAAGWEARRGLALRAAAIMSTWTPATDFNRTDAELRARHLMTKTRAAQITSPKRPATGATWLRAASMDATSEPRTSLQPDTHQNGTLAVLSTWQWVAPGGDSFADHDSYIYYFTFTDHPPYKIRDYTYTRY